MKKITSPADLEAVKAEAQPEICYRERSNTPEKYVEIKVFMDTRGIEAGAKEIMDYIIDTASQLNIEALIYQISGEREAGIDPCLEIRKPKHTPVQFDKVDKKKAKAILEQYIKQNKPADKLSI